MEVIAQKYIEGLRENPDVLGIILFGSRARGNARPDSDYDLIVIVKQGFKKTIVRLDGSTFELIFTTEESCVEYWQGSKDDCIDLWQVAKILFDRDGTINRLKATGDKIKEAGKDPLTSEDIDIARFEIFDQFKSMRNLAGKDDTTTKLLLAGHVIRLTTLFFDIRQFWTPPPKQRLAAIKGLDNKFYEIIADFYGTSSLDQQIGLVEAMAELVFSRAGYDTQVSQDKLLILTNAVVY